MVATVKAGATERAEIVELVNIFEGRILSVGADAVIVSLDGSPEKLDDFTELLRQYGITESQRTGRVALPKLDTATKVAKAQNTQGKAN
jgi:acetolactate synthase-1/3 small subunit